MAHEIKANITDDCKNQMALVSRKTLILNSSGSSGLHPTVMEDGILLLGGLALGVAVGSSEISLLLRNCGPEESAGFSAGEVHGTVHHWRTPSHGLKMQKRQ